MDVSDTDTEDEKIENLPLDHPEGGEDVEEEEEEVFDSKTFISLPILSEKCTMPINILKFDHSYGFSSRKYFNLAMPDPNNLIFTSGNIINFFNVKTSKITFRRSGRGGGIGNIRTNPNPEFKHFAVAENGNKYGGSPVVIIYEWPDLNIVCALKGGSTASFSNLDYSPDGNLLVSQAGDPDYLITIYDWTKHTILLRTKSYVNDVFRVKFSEYVPGQLCTAGIAHIKFWKMCTTFTGLKLMGEVGRFGKTEYSDIVGVLPMPDEKVLSGCAWGNLLVWEGSLIKVEVMRNNRKTLHEDQIVQMFYIEGELWTVSKDGHIKVWWYEKIDQADPPEEDRVVMLEPSYDFYTPGIMLMSVIRRYSDDPENYTYFAQDGNGGIWLLDCNVMSTPAQSEKLFESHSGRVVDMATAPSGPFFATFGQGGRFFLNNYHTRRIIFSHYFNTQGTKMLWLPAVLVRSGDQFILGFQDGHIRCCIVNPVQKPENITLSIIQVIKPHSKSVTLLSINPTYSVLVSGGADNTIFIFQLVSKSECIVLVPIGFVPAPDEPTCIVWNPNQALTLTVGCRRGAFFEAEVPEEPQTYTNISYALKVKTKVRKFLTYKSQIRRDIEIAKVEARKAEKVEKKRAEIRKIQEENPGFEIDEETYLADSESSIKWEPLYIPEKPADIYWMQYTPDNTLWISVSGYDAGYIYEYQIDQPENPPLRFKMIDDADDIEIPAYIHNYNQKYLIFGMRDGTIRVNKMNPKDWRDLSDYWILPMHENLKGFITKLVFSYDERYFFSCGQDRNVFSYTFHPENFEFKPKNMIIDIVPRTKKRAEVPDAKLTDVLSLEEAMIKAEQDRIDKLANENKAIYRKKIEDLRVRYEAILERNEKLPVNQRIKQDHLQIDERVTEAITILMERKLALIRRKLAFDLSKADVLLKKLKALYLSRVDFFPLTISGLKKETTISTLRQKKLPSILFNMHAYIDMKILEADAKGRVVERAAAAAKAKAARKKKAKELEYFLITLSQSTLEMKLDAKFTRLLSKYRTRKAKWESRQDQWEDFMALQPVDGQNHPDDVAALAYAENHIGDFKLKTNKDYKVANYHERETTMKKYRQILLTRRKQYNIRHKFSKKVYNLRELKEEIRQQLLKCEEELKKIHEELPESLQKYGPPIPEQKTSEYPFKQFEVNVLEEDIEFPEEQFVFVKAAKTHSFIKEPDKDGAEHELVLDLHTDQNFESFFQDTELLANTKAVCEFSAAKLVELSKQPCTPWELEILAMRLNRKLFFQEEIIQKMYDLILNFDGRLKDLKNERAQVLVDGLFCDLFLHKLHQELIILRDFEAHEEVLQENVNARMTNVLDMEDDINEVNANLESQELAIERNLEQQGLIHEQFNKLIHDNKFADFLRKVFKKRYKPPKVKKEDDSSSESSSSSSSDSDEEDDAKSIDSRDFGFIKQDLNVCPKGCEQDAFDNTILLRSERHQLEIGVRECQRAIEGFKKDLELDNKKLRVMNEALKASQEELTRYQRLKQEKLNAVECTVILNLDQMKHFIGQNEVCPISECVIISKTELTKLYKRVGELQAETLKLKSRHRVNIKHLARMKTDLKFMHNDMNVLKQKIIEAIKMKFGKVIHIDQINEHLDKKTFGDDIVNDLMEALLRKMVHDLRFSLIDLKSLYRDEIRLWERKLENAETEYAEVLRENTARLDLLNLLRKEKLELSKQIANQDKVRETVQKRRNNAEEIDTELKELREIIKNQETNMDQMKLDIATLKSKVRYPSGMKREEIPNLADRETLEEIDHAADYLYPELLGEDYSDIKFPEFSASQTLQPMESEKNRVVKAIINELINAFGDKLESESVESVIKAMIYPILDYVSMNEIVKEIVDQVGIELTEEDKEALLLSLERIPGLSNSSEWSMPKAQQPHYDWPQMSPSEIKLYVDLVMDDILKDAIKKTKEFKHELSLCNVMMRVVEEIPIDILKHPSASDIISQKLSECMCGSKDSIDKVELARVFEVWDECMCGSKDSIDKVKLAEVHIDWEDDRDMYRKIVEELLRRVFATGLDIITFHRP